MSSGHLIALALALALVACNAITGIDGYRNVDGDAGDADTGSSDARADASCPSTCLTTASACGDTCRSNEATCEAACGNQGCINKCQKDEAPCLDACQSACTACPCGASACTSAIAGGE